MLQHTLRVLLIEDNPGDAELIREYLGASREIDFFVDWADRLHRGLELLAAGGYAVVLVDLTLPDCQGLETFARVRAQAPTTPIVVLSGLNDTTVGIKAVEQGAQDYLVKGQTDRQLLERSLRHAIERKQKEEDLRRTANELA